ncbi:MAG TPA: glutaredoxin family protein [Acidimicrobiia bacterium]|nr:glutaredoxin family protein [Acidimicrobiia bacterium]
MSTLIFLTRDRCPLCDEALPWVEARAGRQGHLLTVIDVDTDPGLRERFGDRVPVVLRDGEEVLAGRFSEREVRGALG